MVLRWLVTDSGVILQYLNDCGDWQSIPKITAQEAEAQEAEQTKRKELEGRRVADALRGFNYTVLNYTVR